MASACRVLGRALVAAGRAASSSSSTIGGARLQVQELAELRADHDDLRAGVDDEPAGLGDEVLDRRQPHREGKHDDGGPPAMWPGSR